jgi:hypothetical protein
MMTIEEIQEAIEKALCGHHTPVDVSMWLEYLRLRQSEPVLPSNYQADLLREFVREMFPETKDMYFFEAIRHIKRNYIRTEGPDDTRTG